MKMDMMAGVAVAALAAFCTPPAMATDGPEYRWNKAAIYADQAAFDADEKKAQRQLADFAQCKGKLGASAKQFKTCLDEHADMLKRVARLYSYASMTNDEDTGADAGIALAQRGAVLYNTYQNATAFMSPEVLALGRNKIEAMLEADKSLAIYRHPLDNMLRMAPHTLDQAGEELIAAYGLTAEAGSNIYGTLSNADMPWPKVKLAEGEVTIDQSAYAKYRAVPDRSERKVVFDAFWGKWKEYERTFGSSFYEQLKRNSVDAKVRKYPDSLTAALDGNKLPRAVYDTLVDQARANLPTLHRYFKLRAGMLGVEEMRYYDIYPPLVTAKRKYGVEESIEATIASAAPLGDEYVDALDKGLRSGWMDVYPRPKKRSGAYMNGWVYDVHPFVLLNHNDDYESLSTLAHEFGHAMHSYLSNTTQPFITSDYATFTAEIASTTNEIFLLEHMLKVAKDDDERLLYLGSALESLRGTFFPQAMFADFEREVHARVDKGEPVTGADLSKLCLEILKRYHGDAEGVVKIDDLYGIEWAYIPHFYRAFSVFQYSTSITAGTAFAERILKGEPQAREKYLNVLKAGGSRYPYEMVKDAGVDLASPAPYQALVGRMNRIMDQIEAIRARRGGK